MELLNSKGKVIAKEQVNVKIEDCPKRDIQGWFELEYLTDNLHLGS